MEHLADHCRVLQQQEPELTHDLNINPKDVFAHEKELSITYFDGALSPELGSPWTHSRALPRVVAKSTKFHEELSDLGNRISMRVILESIDCIK